MIIAVNMKNYRFGYNGCVGFNGFGMLDTETGKFVSHDGKYPYVLRTKKLVTACINNGCPEAFAARIDHK